MVRLQLVISGYSLPLHGILNGHIHNILRLSQQVGEFESYGGFGAQFVGALSAGAPIAPIAPIDAPGGIDVSQVGYACIINVCIYRRAGSTWSTICVCMHACITYACMYTNRRGDRYSARRSSRWVVVVCLKLNMHVL